MAEIFSIKEVIDKLEADECLELEWMTYNRKKKTGGEWLCHEVKLAQRVAPLPPKGEYPHATPPLEAGRLTGIIRPPNHVANKTLNVQIYVDGIPQAQLLKLHPVLIFVCNGCSVI